MGSATNDVFAGEEPVAPAEGTNVVKSSEEENGSLGVLNGVFLNANFFGLFADVGQKFTVGEGTVGTEFVQDFGERGFGHGNFTEMIEEGDLRALVGF
jgi:hypothetical protein